MRQMRTQLVEQVVCDWCQRETGAWARQCLHCARDACAECEAQVFKRYLHGIFSRGMRLDGFYCVSCDEWLRYDPNPDPLHNAYVMLDRLILRRAAFMARIEAKGQELEQQIAELVQARQREDP